MSDYFSREGITREAGGSARQRAANIRLQPLGEEIKYPLTGGAMAQVLMHHQPGIEIQRKVGRQHSLQGLSLIHISKALPTNARPDLGGEPWYLSLIHI